MRTSPFRFSPESLAMRRFVAPLSFTIAAAWIVVVFVLVHHAP
ncbi:hypothetical protein [Couchioplanes caeruleus]|nr:hypothetical protein [Couchioplanes caeruleus]